MKGTIDVQIKHKDGSIETRHEHNVVFDIPAEVLKKVMQTPAAGICYWPYPQLGFISMEELFPTFSLCEDTADLTRPKYLPCTLTTTRSSSSVWYTSPITVTTHDKDITAQASWTLNEAMTIKSIRVMGNYSPDYNRPTRFFPIIDDGGVLYIVGYSSGYGKKLSLSDFKFTNPTTFGRLVPKSQIGSSDSNSYVTTPLYHRYPLVNDERYVLVNSNGDIYTGAPYNTVYDTDKIRIFNSSTGNMVREFPLSQFSGFPTGAQQYVWVINTGTKNILCRRSVYSPVTSASWQIPDNATQDSIPAVNITFPDNFSYPVGVLDNYILYGSESTSSIIRMNDDLSITTYHGRLNGHMSRYSSTNQAPYGYLPTGLTLSAFGSIYYPNLTAANFSTPIELAEGDVLTVSYKIEVS